MKFKFTLILILSIFSLNIFAKKNKTQEEADRGWPRTYIRYYALPASLSDTFDYRVEYTIDIVDIEIDSQTACDLLKNNSLDSYDETMTVFTDQEIGFVDYLNRFRWEGRESGTYIRFQEADKDERFKMLRHTHQDYSKPNLYKLISCATFVPITKKAEKTFFNFNLLQEHLSSMNFNILDESVNFSSSISVDDTGYPSIKIWGVNQKIGLNDFTLMDLGDHSTLTFSFKFEVSHYALIKVKETYSTDYWVPAWGELNIEIGRFNDSYIKIHFAQSQRNMSERQRSKSFISTLFNDVDYEVFNRPDPLIFDQKNFMPLY